jgi:hypothetical protein
MRRAAIASASLALAAGAGIAVAASASTNHHSQVTPVQPAGATATPALAQDVLAARAATARYRTNLARARADGYRIITRMIPNMGYHYMNPSVTGFDVRRPPILVYEHRGRSWQLAALEWVFTAMPSHAPLPGAQYGVFGAACHYVDGTFTFTAAQPGCAPRSPSTGARFSFWHQRLITLHFWIWYPNPAGIYMGTNPLVQPFNRG